MPRNHPDKIFKYPPVQYIPLMKKDEITGDYPYFNTSSRFSIFTPDQEKSLEEKIRSLSYENINYNINENQLALLIFNGDIEYIKYRAYEVFMVGIRNPGKFQVFKIPAEYFYKDRLIFSFYDVNTGERIYRKAFNPDSIIFK